ncbi:uncharacterized protein LOC119341434 [Triticum dicoccoides]|uniref:uncharacterized protein LOC119341434 n=1 Tax=Triticum dicoccoides TaxID=85692 RepID=UPI001891F016|nr:uncharacterized protein LOC119341434 [Triticum dicoccoides]XP_044434492.1 uncharacterized protein LOC123160712 isoform X1 [Triticum aestivum]
MAFLEPMSAANGTGSGDSDATSTASSPPASLRLRHPEQEVPGRRPDYGLPRPATTLTVAPPWSSKLTPKHGPPSSPDRSSDLPSLQKVILAPWVVSCIGTLFNFTLICILVVSWISIIFEYAVLMDRKNNACHSDNLVFTRLRRLA